jgi:putative ABC transport system permease protein
MTARPGFVLFGSLVLGYLRTNRLRSLVTLLAIALGVAVWLAIDLANATAVESFASNVNIVASRVNLQVLGLGRGFDERALVAVQRLPNVLQADPVIEDSVVVGARQGDPLSGEILRVLGVDLLRRLPEGVEQRTALPGGFAPRSSGQDPYALIAGWGAIVSQRIVDRYGLRVGGALAVLADGRPIRLRVVAILPRTVGAADSSVVFVDIATAQEIFGKIGLIDRVDCVVAPNRVAEARAAIARVLPPGTRVVAPEVRDDEVRRLLRSFQSNLAAISYVALLVGAFLIYNTVAISAVQRRSEIGTLRALGATRRQIFGTFLMEGALFGALGSLLGLLFGSLLARFAVGAVARTVDTFYVGTHVDRVVYDPFALLQALAFGTIVAAASAVAPALEAAATPPAQTMRSRGYETRMWRLGIVLGLGGLAFLALAGLSALLPTVDGLSLFGYAAAVCTIVGISLCVPLAVIVTSHLLVRMVYRYSPAALLAATNFGGTPRRNSIAVASLAIAVAMIVSVAVSVSSLRLTVLRWVDETFQADLFVRPLGISGAAYDARLSPQLPARVRALPGVAAVSTFRGISIPFRGSLMTLATTNFGSLAEHNWLRLENGADARTLARTLPGTTGVVISAQLAASSGSRIGDALRLDTPSGPVSFRVMAIYDDYSNDSGTAIVDAGTFARLYHDDSVAMFSVYAKPGADVLALRTRVIRSLLPLRFDVETTGELRSLIVSIFNRTFELTEALNVIAIAIAVMGVVSTLFALVLERRREIGVMRYLGLSIRAVRHMVLYEAALIGILGGLFGIVCGTLLGLLLVLVIDRQAFGAAVRVQVPYGSLATSLLLVAAAALLAGLYPAQVAARIRTAEAVRTE